VSNESGASFGSTGGTPDSLVGLAVHPTSPEIIYAAGQSRGVFVSGTSGADWSLASNGIDAPRIASVAIAPGTSGTVLVSAGEAVRRTINGGTSWEVVAPRQAGIRFDPAVSTRAYLCGFGYFATSTNSGAMFDDGMRPDLGSCFRFAIAGTTVFGAAGTQLYKSINRGATWAVANVTDLGNVTDVAAGDAAGDVVVVATSNGVYRSTDGGSMFTQVTNDYTPAVIADPRTAGHVIAGKCRGLSVSSNGGATFAAFNTDLCVNALGAAGSALYAVGSSFSGTGSNARVMKSSDGGASWTPIETAGGVPDSTIITSIAASDDGQTIYLGTTAGLYRNSAR
jgi:hypothetical protein